jgi:short-subunit dehydrogenase
VQEIRKQVVLLTGASAGLGLEIAKRLIKENYHVVLTARRNSLPRFEQTGISESDSVWIRALDVCQPQEREEVVEEITTRLGGVDILINNAAFMYRSVLEHVQETEVHEQMGTNFAAPLALIRLCLPAMRARRSGKIINISSVGGMMAMPTMGIYNASKFALEGASEALYYELKPWKISVTLVEPGFINSDSFKLVRYTTKSGESMRDPAEAYYGHYRFMTDFINRTMGIAPGTPERVAKTVLRVLTQKNPPLRVAGTPEAWLFDLARRLLPRKLYHWALYQGLPHADCWGDEQRLRRRCDLELEKIDRPAA